MLNVSNCCLKSEIVKPWIKAKISKTAAKMIKVIIIPETRSFVAKTKYSNMVAKC